MAAAKFKVADIVEADSHILADEFSCAICLHIVDAPVQTPCGHVFCNDCLVQSIEVCPTCRTPLGRPAGVEKLVECNKVAARMMLSIRVRCPYGKKVESESGTDSAGSAERQVKRQRTDEMEAPAQEASGLCSWRGTYGDLMGKHLAECRCHAVTCPYGCGEQVKRGDLEAHALVCKEKFDKCEICADLVRPGMLAEHRKEKAELHVQLLLQKTEQLKNEMAAEKNVRDAIIESLQASLLPIAKSDQVANVIKMRNDELKKEILSDLRAVACTEFRWDVGVQADIRASHSKGKWMTSPTFNFGAFGEWSVQYYPCGDSAATDDQVSVFIGRVHTAKKMFAKIQLQINSASYAVENEMWESPWGRNNVASPVGEKVTITAKLLSAAWRL
eukprot:TRINITY_DN122955_c0_g1_i1.p1 TRINITY_DN122955_c0_g1~~TRINITY_DN122955_c0_g1_i1.p1  ORF type:complete len:413 (-),score=58.60 TRINITY_DN122955_c0_g1_i1:235-1398(-)